MILCLHKVDYYTLNVCGDFFFLTLGCGVGGIVLNVQ